MNKNTTTPLDTLKDFLNKLFQFESQDLDFGVYKILHYKQKEIKTFIDKLLVDKVKSELKTLTAEEISKAKEQLEELKETSAISKWLKAIDENDTQAVDDLEKYFAKEIKDYIKVKSAAEAGKVSVATENQIYNYLTLFFSRYYDKGDFISKRRFGKNEKYVVPYNGEETHFYWANYDQYYIKSSETFKKYSFKSPKPGDPLTVHFKLTEAQVEQGNVKDNENKYFVLSEKEPELQSSELTIYFEYRALTEEEKKEVGTQAKQDKLNNSAAAKLQKLLSKKAETAELWVKKDEDTFLLKKLNHYTKSNTYDFFIHKNLKGFLQRELDYYIKSELVNVDDLYVQETEAHFERIKHNLKEIKVFKNIADTIIEFLSQIEEFQKKLWEKKKFVLSTEWVITIDRLVCWIGEKDSEPILKEVLKNKEQITEWKALFGEEIFKNWNNIKYSDLSFIPEQGELDKTDEERKSWKKLPIDTAHFAEVFKFNLLNLLSAKIDIEANADGLVIHSDNYQGLMELITKLSESIRCIHIDPPYNTNTSGFLYKNSFKHSSWLTFMKDRLMIAQDTLDKDSCLQIHIDDNEYEYLYHTFNDFPLLRQGTIVWDKRNPVSGASRIATQHEYILCYSKGDIKLKSKKSNAQLIIDKAKEIINDHNRKVSDTVKKQFKKWVKDNVEFTNGEKAYSELDDDGRVFQSVHMGAPEQRTDPKFFKALIHPKSKKPCPVPSSGWSGTPDFMKQLLDNNEIIFGKDETTQPRRKYFLDSNIIGELSTVISSGKKGKSNLEVLGLDFPYNHPVELYADLIWSVTENKSGMILDYFAGSGTTFHATQILNRDDKGNRKCVLIEQGDYVYTVILPRIKKISYTFDWKDGKPKDNTMNGLGVFFKYQKLEQYEESLENISFNLSKDAVEKALEFDEYIPKYFLEFETKNSATLVNTDAMQDPWDYKLKIWNGLTYDEQKAADLQETFNYLIGLHMQKFITKEYEGKRYQFIYGTNNSNKKILIVWRNIKNWKKKDYEKDREIFKTEIKNYQHDILYINGQAHLENYEPIELVFKSKMIN